MPPLSRAHLSKIRWVVRRGEKRPWESSMASRLGISTELTGINLAARISPWARTTHSALGSSGAKRTRTGEHSSGGTMTMSSSWRQAARDWECTRTETDNSGQQTIASHQTRGTSSVGTSKFYVGTPDGEPKFVGQADRVASGTKTS